MPTRQKSVGEDNQCQGRTVKNKRCKNAARRGRAYCGRCYSSRGHMQWDAQSGHETAVGYMSGGIGLPPDLPFGTQGHETPAEFIDSDAYSEDILVRKAVASRSDCSHATLAYLAGDAAFTVRYAVAHNRRTDDEILDIMSDDVEVDVRYEVGARTQSPSTLKKMVDRLLSEVPEDYKIQWKINKDIRQHVSMEDGDISELLALNSRTPPESLIALSKIADEEVAYALATNRAAPVEALENVSRHFLERYVWGWYWEKAIDANLIGHPNSTAEIVSAHFHWGDQDKHSQEIRRMILGSERFLPEVQDEVLDHIDELTWDDCGPLTENKAIRYELLHAVLFAQSGLVAPRLAAADFPTEFPKLSSEQTESVLRSIHKYEGVGGPVDLSLSTNVSTPVDILHSLALNSQDADVLYELAGNRRVPMDALMLLALWEGTDDTERRVAAKAADTVQKIKASG